MSELILCAIVKNEALYIQEWIDFHLEHGASSILLYDNLSDDNTAELATKASNRVSVFRWAHHPGQMSAYAHALHSLSVRNAWCAFLDADEYLFSVDDQGRIDDGSALRATLNRLTSQQVAALAVHWRIFGTSGRVERRAGSTLARFVRRGEINRHVKSILNLRHPAAIGANPHVFSACPIVRLDDSRIVGLDIPADAVDGPIRLHHYATRSRNECAIKIERGRADTGGQHALDNYLLAMDRNEIVDDTLASWGRSWEARRR